MISFRDSRPASRDVQVHVGGGQRHRIGGGTGGGVAATTAAVEVASSTWAWALSLATVEPQTQADRGDPAPVLRRALEDRDHRGLAQA